MHAGCIHLFSWLHTTVTWNGNVLIYRSMWRQECGRKNKLYSTACPWVGSHFGSLLHELPFSCNSCLLNGATQQVERSHVVVGCQICSAPRRSDVWEKAKDLDCEHAVFYRHLTLYIYTSVWHVCCQTHHAPQLQKLHLFWRGLIKNASVVKRYIKSPSATPSLKCQ